MDAVNEYEGPDDDLIDRTHHDDLPDMWPGETFEAYLARLEGTVGWGS
jgi:hypothetical protein